MRQGKRGCWVLLLPTPHRRFLGDVGCEKDWQLELGGTGLKIVICRGGTGTLPSPDFPGPAPVD